MLQPLSILSTFFIVLTQLTTNVHHPVEKSTKIKILNNKNNTVYENKFVT